ncbi:hypothetical protein A3H80_01975 [Candidatus Roizmanbacteria bacterium RIFCSPLOWO2_02_FULL_37_19]|nr:MAG: hypothetical protein A2862_02560 [Candidatus Roizmanbacteria bacterium RIFCSPHIGHO2_01_FULL_38_41]OGK32292.1 MAG: hypothetical protein A3E10_04780 [Candidatus Roizmanbacteria bacterium RIFCSPHIGHO2_12_FULL_37_23]OGK43588.1 MAG: hypothetical protein A2956_02170 [Candidatus Roizmanbacteria bacterium RIFCSPLOWO2_01_FULL_37_57]OGK54312.1 MAG: hypothetical protein A3H80_01975 [Candidatus Roizmanbacteria bacterium RIFCSPLOWO2_02_FULL_37_19]OGK61873.1 MAG: hypothetical protein A3G65_02675 [Can
MRMLAQIDPKTLPTVFPPARFVSISNFMDLLLPLIMLGAVLLFLVMLIAGSYRIITAGGTPEFYDSGKKMIQYSVGGLIIVGLSYFLVRLIGFITEVDFFL